ncbi:MAG: dicarboxylate/amino acid:cation symporter [Alphaproteobacteria bacterium]|nr:dicarboxylate/amino acid:cation symporter [Alphaproteobacteria bacterium]NCQ66252.1 dicarboxylate/amino acid:cation symporter [Alphaproteobacteria bacterium]NCT06600.1 dicarboxylate/amino acid:cation symporter [Alphaproteobacteria bacterium]
MRKFLSDFKMPLILITEIIVCLLFGDFIPLSLKSGLYAVSLTLKEILLFVLPFVIFSFLLNSIGILKKGAFSFVALAFSMVVISNFTATVFGGFLGIFTLGSLGFIEKITLSQDVLKPLWHFDLPQLISNDTALFSGLAAGVVLSLTGHQKSQEVAQKLYKASFFFLKRCFIPVLPLFILGFILKMQHDGLLISVLQHYLPIAILIIFVSVSYILTLFAVALGFDRTRWVQGVKNLVPGMLTGFTTMSSASTMPLVIDAVEKNTTEPFATGVVPVSINTHLVGDCFSMSIQAVAILISFGYDLPSLTDFLLFAVFFVIARFAVAGVPGGGVLMTLPVFEKYLGFSGEMLSLITALYILFDPLITPVNVLGHGTFAQLFEKLYKKVLGKTGAVRKSRL